MKLSIIIVNYNVKFFLEQCLASVKSAIVEIDAEVLVIDNSSTDGSIEYLQEKYSFVNFIRNKTNEGFAKANNTALKQCTGDYILFLNPDTIIPENILKQCIDFFTIQKDVGAISVQMIDGSGAFLPESKRAFPSPNVSFNKLSGLSSIFPKSAFFNKYALGNLDKDTVHIVDVLCGAFMMAERKTLLQLNGFDESFFMYGEDIDLSYRIQQLGKKNYYLGNLSIIHFKGESAGNNKSKHTKRFYQAMHVFVNKHYKGFNSFTLKSLLRSGIFLRKSISLLSNPVRSLKRKLNVTNLEKERNIYLIGDVISTEQAEKIMLKHKLQKTFKGSVMIEKREKFIDISGAEIIFCTGIHSYEEAINVIKQKAKKNKYMWHGLYTQSIAGSADKRETGIVYVAENGSTDSNNYPKISKQFTHAGSDKNVQVSDTTEAS